MQNQPVYHWLSHMIYCNGYCNIYRALQHAADEEGSSCYRSNQTLPAFCSSSTSVFNKDVDMIVSAVVRSDHLSMIYPSLRLTSSIARCCSWRFMGAIPHQSSMSILGQGPSAQGRQQTLQSRQPSHILADIPRRLPLRTRDNKVFKLNVITSNGDAALQIDDYQTSELPTCYRPSRKD